MQSIIIVDHGMGNARSVLNACVRLGADVKITADIPAIRDSPGIILPGVGAFAEAMDRLNRLGLTEILTNEVMEKGKPYLGICLGMQLLFPAGTEFGSSSGLGWLPGEVLRLDELAGFPTEDPPRLPHIGWNSVIAPRKGTMFAEEGAEEDFYFVHTYATAPADERVVSGYSQYGAKFAAAIEVNNISATQFHPEKSHKAGLKLLSNWLRSVAAC